MKIEYLDCVANYSCGDSQFSYNLTENRSLYCTNSKSIANWMLYLSVIRSFRLLMGVIMMRFLAIVFNEDKLQHLVCDS